MSKTFVLLVFLCTLFLVSCAKKAAEPQVEASVAKRDTLELRIAEFLGNAAEGAAATFHGSRFGSLTVVAGAGYLSALGIPCREGRMQGGSRTKIAACQDPKQGWVLAPDILGDGAL
ncbi:MAG: hypothetical protein IJU76_02605 [Desulfovibrionaceae bacterium]|nr:hypothetical protein [Desulfovibrionaceae bacterium]